MPNPKAVIDEMMRIAKPGVGRIVTSEPDWETLVIILLLMVTSLEKCHSFV